MIDDGGQHGGDVAHVAEASGLGAVAVHLEWFVTQGPLDESREHHAVVADLPGTHGVEEAGDHGAEPVLGVVGEREMLVDGLAHRVRPAADGGGAEDQVVVLAEGELGRLAVHLGTAGDQHAGAQGPALRVGEPQEGGRLLDVGVDGADGVGDDEAHAHGRRQVEDAIEGRVRERPRQGVGQVRLQQGQPRVRLGQVHATAGREVVDHRDVIARGEEFPHQVRADEARPPGHQRPAGPAGPCG
jgi:hypothetical protein